MTYEYGKDCPITFKRLTSEDENILKEFKCDNLSIKDFIRNQSINSLKDVSYLFIDTENNIIVGFCSICCTGIQIVEKDMENHLYSTLLPAIEIDFFAIDERYRNLKFDEDSDQYETLSSVIFLNVLEHIFKISNKVVGATHICLYSVPKAENFYARCGFRPFKDYMKRDEQPFLKGCIPMFLSMNE